jgi:predicted XRE-type DNA-binding protein
MAWIVRNHDDFDPEFDALPVEVQDELLAMTALLEAYGPGLGRPHADTLAGSKHANMKELRFKAADDPAGGRRQGGRRSKAVLQRADRQGGQPVHRALEGVEGDLMMGRTREEIMAALPKARQTRIDARAAELVGEVEGLKALREMAERSQEQIAQALGVKQPSVLKMERQADLYLSTLRRFVEAAGGTLELRVELPGKGVLHLTGLGDITH